VPEAQSWSTQQLVEFLAAVSSFEDERSARCGAVERTAEALDAQVAALVCGESVHASIGFPAGREPHAELVAAAAGDLPDVAVPGVGRVKVAVVPLEDEEGSRLLVGRAGGEGFSHEEIGLLRGMARVLALTVRMLRGLSSLRQRQQLLEQSSQIQRAITRRAPLDDVLGAIAVAARELLGDDIAGLWMIDRADPESTVLMATSGVTPDVLLRIEHGAVGEGAGGRAIAEGALVIVENYQDMPTALQAFAEVDVQSAMAAPVHEGGTVVGSLAVASYRPARSYSEAEQEMLVAFAEHASLALMDAKTVDLMLHQALHDSLTGLPNRRLFLDRLQHALQRRGERSKVAVLFLDLDRFKEVNDTLGHDAGDRLLVEVAGRLRDCMRPSDTIARLGGDEFAVLMEELDADRDAGSLAERMDAALREPVALDGREVFVTASMGIALQRGGGGDPLRDADTAMYRAKAAGGGAYEFFEESMRWAVTRRLGLEADIRRGIRGNEFVLHYQPILDLDSSTVVAVEALARWQHPDQGLLPPAAFVPVAEETGSIVEIGRWVLQEACRQLAEWQVQYPRERPLGVSVNLSGRQLQQPHLALEVARAVDETGIDPACLVLELTETMMMQDTEATLETLRSLKRQGVRLALDDFGTGYSSLRNLRAFPLDMLKIPRPFVEGIERGLEESALARASLQLGGTFGLDVVAEGIETREQLAALRRLGCRFGQGFLLARPEPPERLETLLASRPLRAIPALARVA
jgi:diguanylate cyclase (GGDEF)-like protein